MSQVPVAPAWGDKANPLPPEPDARKERIAIIGRRVKWMRKIGFYSDEDVAEIGEWVKNAKGSLFFISAVVYDDFQRARQLHSVVPHTKPIEKECA